MNPVRQFIGLLRKEIQIEIRHRLSFVNRLLVGPLVSVLSSGMLFHGVFRVQKSLNLGGLNSDNFVPTLFLGFTAHTCFNSGYYCLPAKIFQEWHGRTLPLLWTTSSGQGAAIAGLAGFELARCLIVFFGGLLLLSISHPIPTETVVGGVGLIFLAHTFAVALGFIRAMCSFRYPALYEVFEYAFLGMTFTSCFYLPKELLPNFLHPICDFNPGYHLMQAMCGMWFSEGTLSTHLAAFSAALILVIVTCLLFWRMNREELIEKCFA